ncbi:hypothetical protein CsSME_00011169 [Camellia sinensis var. sinensis]
MAAEEPPAPPSLPQYPEMIMAAIEALNDKNGSSKSAITKHIEATASSDVPGAHATLLSHHLNKMKQSGQLVMVKNNYMKPDPNAPPRRSRGRPPEPKAQPPPDAEEASPPRPRGRPPKSTDPLAPPPATKKAKTDAPATPPPSGERRGRGRPPKVKPAVAAQEGSDSHGQTLQPSPNRRVRNGGDGGGGGRAEGGGGARVRTLLQEVGIICGNNGEDWLGI